MSFERVLYLIKNDGSLLPVAYVSYASSEDYNGGRPQEIRMAPSTAPQSVNEFHRQLIEEIASYPIVFQEATKSNMGGSYFDRHILQRKAPRLIEAGDIAGSVVGMVYYEHYHAPNYLTNAIFLVTQVSQRGVRRLGYLFISSRAEIYRNRNLFELVKKEFAERNDSITFDPKIPQVIRIAMNAEPVYGVEGPPGRRKKMELTNTVTEGVPKRTFPPETNYEESESDTEMQPLPPTTSEDESPESE